MDSKIDGNLNTLAKRRTRTTRSILMTLTIFTEPTMSKPPMISIAQSEPTTTISNQSQLVRYLLRMMLGRTSMLPARSINPVQHCNGMEVVQNKRVIHPIVVRNAFSCRSKACSGTITKSYPMRNMKRESQKMQNRDIGEMTYQGFSPRPSISLTKLRNLVSSSMWGTGLDAAAATLAVPSQQSHTSLHAGHGSYSSIDWRPLVPAEFEFREPLGKTMEFKPCKELRIGEMVLPLERIDLY
mmetsp:Transcript_74653/g.136394  ORF Transcript_74653/g.136394 Transcript_74653/m.136394 type:complete len:241 (+) Transcript_74653:1483-2205(+)